MRRFHIEMTRPDGRTLEYSINADGSNLTPPNFGLDGGTIAEIEYQIRLSQGVISLMEHLKHLEATEEFP